MNYKVLELLVSKFKIFFCFADNEFNLHFDESSPILTLLGHSSDEKNITLTELFPELFGAESELMKIFTGELDEYEIPRINRNVHEEPVFFNLCIVKMESDEKHLLVIVEDISSEGILHQQIQQSRNENQLLRLEVQKKNSVLETAHQEIAFANKELKKLLRLKDDFLAIASHDLRSPFNAILGFSEILLDDPQLHESHKEMISLINQSANMQLKYITDILNVLKLETGQLKLDLSKKSIKELIGYCTSILTVLASKKEIRLEVNIKSDYRIQIDFEKIAQVINNLISNAIKFTPRNGMIEISAFENEENLVEIHVKDTGVGIEEYMLPKLFSRYTKTHRQGTDGEMGTGLGLAICKNLVAIHNGEIFAKSTVGKGSEFWFTLPKGTER